MMTFITFFFMRIFCRIQVFSCSAAPGFVYLCLFPSKFFLKGELTLATNRCYNGSKKMGKQHTRVFEKKRGEVEILFW